MAKLTGKAKAKFLARMKKGRKAAKGKKKSGGAKRKTSSVKRLEARIEDLERQLSLLGGIQASNGGEYHDVLSRIKSGQLSSTRKELDDELKRELESGRNG